MKSTRAPSGPTLPWILVPVVRLLQWVRTRLGTLPGLSGTGRHGSSDIGAAMLVVGAITTAAVIGLPPLLTMGGGIGMAILFVVARSWIVVQDQQAA